MQNESQIARKVLGSMAIILVSHFSYAQSPTASQARQYAAGKNYDKAIEMYGQLYGISPDSVYAEYLSALIAAQKYKQAEKVVEHQMDVDKQNYLLHIDLGNVYLKEGKEGKAKDQFESVLKMINGDDMVTQRMVRAFTDVGQDDYAIRTYERASELLSNPYIYGNALAALYAKKGNFDKAIDILLTGLPGQGVNLENARTMMLELLGNNPERLQAAQKVIIKKINAHPENAYFAELLTWVYTQKNDWDGALIQIEAIDERNKEDGQRLMMLARNAIAAKQYETAGKAYDDVIAKGNTLPYYTAAKSEKLGAALAQIKNNPERKPEEVNNLLKQYDAFFSEFPKFYATTTASDYAMLAAQYGNDVPRGIEILKRAISEPDTRRNMAAAFKLQTGDYYLLEGKLWDASLIYSQVDKDFKQDAMGEDARFRNAKLAYYRGDFDWAQRDLSILKASTSELIANDALYLSVLITENVEDSNQVPLQRFAHADLLLFENKDNEAEKLLDSLNSSFRKHPLNDDILMKRAEIALKHHDYNKALGYLKNIVDTYGTDVLGDDAVYRMADIYQNDLHQNDLAKQYYEKLIIDYPGSTYVQAARQHLTDLNGGTHP